MKKVAALILIMFLWFFVSLPSAYAASEFTTTYNSDYVISKTGKTSVTHTITLKNNVAHIYATHYTLSTSGEKLDSVSASDEFGPLIVNTTSQNGATTIDLQITHPAIGFEKTKTITLHYQTEDIVEVIGNTTSVNIPRLAKANEAESYTRIVHIENPNNTPSLIAPPPNKIEPDGESTIYTFNGHVGEALTLLFGNSVTYKVNVTYELKNKELRSLSSELALPPDTAYQSVEIAQINPEPTDIHLDDDGNWLARYNLKPQEKLVVTAQLYLTVYPVPTLYDPSTKNLEKTTHSKYWDTQSANVSDLASKLKTPKNIYDYLVQNFTYNYESLARPTQRLGSAAALNNPASVLCTEFTDSFVALARLNGVPAREIDGYGYTSSTSLHPQSQETDVLHAWPEYYDESKGSWISIDPTWGNTTGGTDYFTKLDFSHLAFVRHGIEDSYPLPAGAYKSNPSDKYVHVEVVPSREPVTVTPLVKSNNGHPTIYNPGPVSLQNQDVQVGSKLVHVDYLAPYASVGVEQAAYHSIWDKVRGLVTKLATWLHIR